MCSLIHGGLREGGREEQKNLKRINTTLKTHTLIKELKIQQLETLFLGLLPLHKILIQLFFVLSCRTVLINAVTTLNIGLLIFYGTSNFRGYE